MTTATKTLITASWTPTKVQQETAEAFARNMATTMTVLCKLGPDAVQQYQTASTEAKVQHLKQMGVKTPIELVKAMSEAEANLFGSKINVWGDDKQASMEYEVCGCFNAMQKVGVMNEKNQEEMGKSWVSCMERTAKEFGFSKAEVKFGTKPEEKSAVITFTK